METIMDMNNYVRSRQRKGKSRIEIARDLEKHGYDRFAAYGLVNLHWEFPSEEDDN